MRTSSAATGAAIAAALLAAACHRTPASAPPGEATGGQPETTAQVADNPDNHVLCQPAGTSAMMPACTLTREQTPRGLVLTLARPDGGFRRLLVLPGGRGLVAADGAERAHVQATGPTEVEVTIGGDRFRMPAKLPPR